MCNVCSCTSEINSHKRVHPLKTFLCQILTFTITTHQKFPLSMFLLECKPLCFSGCFPSEAADSRPDNTRCLISENLNGSVLNATRLSLRGMWKGFSETVLQGAALHTEPLLILAQSALCHCINQEPWPQVAHRSHSHTTALGRNSGCAHHMHCLQRGNQSCGLSRLPAPPPLSLDAHCTMPSTPH